MLIGIRVVQIFATRANFEMIYKNWASQKAICEVDSSAKALWDKTTCSVLLANNSSDFNRADFIISTFYGLNNNYGNGQPTKNLFHKYEVFIKMQDVVKMHQMIPI